MGSENPVPAGSLDGLQGTGRPLAGKPGDLTSDTGPGSIVSLYLGSEPLILICRVETPTSLSTEDIEGKHQGLANAKWGFVNCMCQPGLGKFMAFHTALCWSQENIFQRTKLTNVLTFSLCSMLAFLSNPHYTVYSSRCDLQGEAYIMSTALSTDSSYNVFK